MRRGLSVVVAAVLVTVAGAHCSYAASGRDLYNQCLNARRVANGYLPSERQAVDANYCYGYLDGVAAGLIGDRLFCPPPDVATGQIVAAYLNWADAHPQSLNVDRWSAIAVALASAWPWSRRH